MKKIKSLIVLLGALFIFYGCRQDPLPPAILITPDGIHIDAVPNSLLEFTIHAFSDETELRNIVITRKPENGITTTILDTAVTGLEADFFYHYPVVLADDQAVLTFTVYNTKGESGAAGKRIYLIEGEQGLTETQGYSLYSRYSLGNPNAFNIDSTTFYQIPSNPDSTLVDLVEYDQTQDDQLSNTLTSWSGVEFVKNNAFNYAEATNSSASASFNSSTPLQVVNNIATGDILIVKYDVAGDKYAVLKITGVNETGSDETNNYTFDLKK